MTLSQAVIPHTLLSPTFFSPSSFSFFFFYQTIPHVIISIQGLIGRKAAHYDENTDLILHYIQTLIYFLSVCFYLHHSPLPVER